jgi:4-diphosphocytidyl-2-C-methyl-D-erythritol kinase
MLLGLRELARLLSFDAKHGQLKPEDWPLSGDTRLSHARRIEMLDELAALSLNELAAKALRIGADVPFFLRGGTCLAEGYGERLTALPPLPALPILLAVPSFGSNTASAYAALERDTKERQSLHSPDLTKLFADPDLLSSQELLFNLQNDFEAVLYTEHPQYLEWTETLLDAGAKAVSLSGSGSAFYGLFTTEEAAQRARAMLANDDSTFRHLDVHLPLAG